MSSHLHDPPDLTGLCSAVQQTQEFERTVRRTEAAFVEHLDTVDRSAVYLYDGHRDIRGFQMACAHVSRAQARDRWLTVLLCRRMPEVLQGLHDADLGVEQVRLLARTGVRPRVGHLLTSDPDMFALLLQQARELTYADFERAIAHWVSRADADGREPDHRTTHQQRTASITVSGDRVIVRAVLPAAVGAEIEAILNSFGQGEFTRDVHESTTPGWLPRTDSQRRADAFVNMCLASLGPEGGVTVSVGIVMDAATFDAALTGQAVPLDAAGVRGRCHTLTGIPLEPADAATAALWGHIHRVVIDAAETVINLGRSSRLFTGSARKAAQGLGDWCEMPGCHHRAHQVDHLHPWSRGGLTNQPNAARLCAHHNRWKATSDITVGRSPRGNLVITRSNHTRLTTV
jgi:hypothetical protein